MLRAQTCRLAVVFAVFVLAAAIRPQSSFADKNSADSYSGSQDQDTAAAREMFALANQARAQAGVPPLQFNQTLSEAATSHTEEMIGHRQLSHQFSGEAGLMQRLTADTDLLLDSAGENVAYAPTVIEAHQSLMHSPPHRKNLLDPSFNLVGISVVRDGKLLYVTEDFGHGSMAQSGAQAEDAVVHAVAAARNQAGMSSLRETRMTVADQAACSMAQAGSLSGPPLPGRHIVRYTSYTPSQLPAVAAKVIDGGDVQEFSVGTCYKRSTSDSEGVYYVVLVLK